MLSASEIVLEYVCPAAGTICATFMFTAPFRDVLRATSETGQLGDLNPTPWAFMLGNCFGWVVYSVLIQNLFVFFANAPGFVLSVWLNMAAVKLQYENHKRNEMRKSVIGALRAESSRRLSLLDEPSDDLSKSAEEATEDPKPKRNEQGTRTLFADYAHIVWEVTAQHQPSPAPHERLVMGMVLYWLAIVSVIAFGQNAFNDETREIIVGTTVNANLVFFYGSPLSTIAAVLRTRSSVSIHVRTMITNTANGIFWCAYGIAVFDLFIAIPNGLGAALGGIQMVLCVLFPRKEQPARMDVQDAQSRPSFQDTEQSHTVEEVEVGIPGSSTPAES